MLLLLLLSSQPGAAASDPLTGRAAAAAGGTGGLVLSLAAAQHRLNEAISAAFGQLHDGRSGSAFLLVLVLAFCYGALHAVGPGHGKAVVAAYFLANRARWTSGAMMGGLVSLVQGVTAVAVVGLLAVLLQWRQFDVLNRSTLVELVSYGLIGALGLVMLFRAVTGRGCVHQHAEGAHDHGHEHGSDGNA